jgi:transposase
MANQLQMDQQAAVRTLRERGYSERRIARELGIHRATVRRYARQDSKCTKVLTGTAPQEAVSKCTKLPTGNGGQRSLCGPFHETIVRLMDLGLDAQRIHQDLRFEHGFTGAYDSVRRYVKTLQEVSPERIWRMECLPAEEAQVDYGEAWVLEPEAGRRLRKVNILRVTLSYSRKSYSEAMLRQDTESFIRALENAFRHFGGVPERLCPDNLKAAVLKADWHDPDLNPKIIAFAAHYGFAVTPTRPVHPHHKGKVESAVKYVKNNALKGRRFRSLADLNGHLLWWEQEVADRRIHGTTKKQVHAHFETAERGALRPLPPNLFPCFQEAPRRVHRDSFVEVAGAYYEVPEEYIRQQVWVRWDKAMVRVFNDRMNLIASHCRLERGAFTRTLGVEGARGSVAQSTRYYRSRIERLGSAAGAWADAVIEREPHKAIRYMQGLLSLGSKYPAERIERSCSEALMHGQYRLRDLRHRLQNQAPDQATMPFLQQHELIRDLTDYGQYVGEGLFT